MQKKEAKLETKLGNWLRLNARKHWDRTINTELKQTKGPLPFSRVLPHQRTWLKSSKDGVTTYKIPDSAFGMKPFDRVTWVKAPGYVVVYYEGSKRFYFIDIDDFLNEEKYGGRKSLTEERADVLSFIKVRI